LTKIVIISQNNDFITQILPENVKNKSFTVGVDGFTFPTPRSLRPWLNRTRYTLCTMHKHCPIVNTAPFHDGGRGSFSLLLSPLLAAYFCISAKFVRRLFGRAGGANKKGILPKELQLKEILLRRIENGEKQPLA
jgi:hypothetical protein